MHSVNGAGIARAGAGFMGCRGGIWALGIAFLAFFAGCPPETYFDNPPYVSLQLDPNYGEAPLDVVCTANAYDPDGYKLTYSWDFGDGTVCTGKPTMLHTYTQLGRYSVRVTVSDGKYAVTDGRNVRVSNYPSQSSEIGPGGGSVEEEGIFSCRFATILVPPGVAPAPTVFKLSEWPSLAALDAKQANSERFQWVGSAYRVDFPLKTSSPISVVIGYDDALIPPGFLPQNLTVMQRLIALEERADKEEASGDRPLLADNVPLAALVNTEARTIQFDLYAGALVQLAVLEEPFETAQLDFGTKQGGTEYCPSVRVLFEDPPENPEWFLSVLEDSLPQAWQVLVSERGFRNSAAPLRVIVRDLGEMAPGLLYLTDDATICLNRDWPNAGEMMKTIAHLYFHALQNTANNFRSKIDNFVQNQWFVEGTACWAADEVFDAQPGGYHATQPGRFHAPLDTADYNGQTEYQTVAFWKWVEAENPGMIRATLYAHCGITHDLDLGGVLRENAAPKLFKDPFVELWPEADFTAFVCTALFRKQFENDEIQVGDLWADDALGAYGVCPANPEDTYVLHPGHPGESAENPLVIHYEVQPALSADWFLFKTGPDSALSGTLHMAFELVTGEAPLDAVAYAFQFGDIAPIAEFRDLRQPHPEAAGWFTEGVEIGVFIVDPRWGSISDRTTCQGQFTVWIQTDYERACAKSCT